MLENLISWRFGDVAKSFEKRWIAISQSVADQQWIVETGFMQPNTIFKKKVKER